MSSTLSGSKYSAALPEIAGSAALYFDPLSVGDITAALSNFLSSPELQDELRIKARLRAAEFTWARTAADIFDHLVQMTPREPAAFGPAQRRVKRFMDLALLVIGAPLVTILLAVIYLVIKLDSPGPALFKQTRLGRAGKEIEIWKFRTMALDAESILANYLGQDAELRKEWDEGHKLKNDPRITRFGRFLRHTSLDELPQVWNILRGEMSLVGPRPIVDEELSLYGADFEIYKQAIPGLTGLWQVSGRNDLPYDERVRLDVLYVKTWSLWLDLGILTRTAWVALRGQGAY